MKWFNIARVKKKNPSKKEPKDNPIEKLYHYVIDKADISLYKFLDSDSLIEFYDMGNYFLARQYMIDRSTANKSLYAEYHLTLTDEAKKVVDALLVSPVKYYVTPQNNNLVFIFQITYSVKIPTPRSPSEEAVWYGQVFIYREDKRALVNLAYPTLQTTIPFNCGPLRPVWERAVECWMKEFSKMNEKLERLEKELYRMERRLPRLEPEHIEWIRKELLATKYLSASITIVPFIYKLDYY
ncbi:MAG: hypothetical protein QXS96_04785 [Candidatus Caldarchaeum sp.]